MKDTDFMQKYVLGAFMMEDCFYRVNSILHDDCFDSGINRNVYHAIKSLHAKGFNTDPIAVINEIKSKGTVSPADIFGMTTEVNRTDDLEKRCMILKEYAVGVQLTKHVNKVTALFRDKAPLDVLDMAQSELNRISQLAFDNANKSFKAVVPNVINEIGQRMLNKGQIFGIPSRLPSLDKVTGGFQNSDLVIIAARPGMGKTAFVLECATGAAQSFAESGEKKAVGIISLEMSSDQLIKRLIISKAEIDNERVKKGQITKEEYTRLCDAASFIQQLPVEISDKQGQTISQVRSFCQKLKHEQGLGMIVVDYLQLMTDPNHKSNKVAEVTAISQALKGLAKDFNVPVLALSQLSRAVESRGGDKVPQLSDLRDSGGIEQDADMIMFIYRPEYYGITSDEDGNSTTGRADVLIKKNRNGKTDNVYLQFKGKYIKFCEPDYHEYTPYQEVQAIEQNNLTGRFEPEF